jgi:hypothetical protein
VLGHSLDTLVYCYLKQDTEAMEAGIANTHHAALLRTHPSSNTFALARHDPTRLPDSYLLPREARPAGSMPKSQISRRPSPNNYMVPVSRRMRAHEMSARDYIERSGGRARQYQESAHQSSSPPPRESPEDQVQFIERSERRPAVMVRRGSKKPGPTRREREELRPEPQVVSKTYYVPEPVYDPNMYAQEQIYNSQLPHHKSPRRDGELARTYPSIQDDNIEARPRRAYVMQTDVEHESDFRPPPMRRADNVPVLRRERESDFYSNPPPELRRSDTMPDGPPWPSPRRERQPNPNRKFQKSQKSTAQRGRDPFVEHQQRFDMVCETISRDDTSGEHTMVSFFVRTAMEPHMRDAEPHVDALVPQHLIPRQIKSDMLEKQHPEDGFYVDSKRKVTAENNILHHWPVNEDDSAGSSSWSHNQYIWPREPLL